MKSVQKEKELLFSLTKKDFTVETMRCSGAGGQHRDKTSNGVRIKHLESGATGECKENRSQLENKKTAFLRLVSSSAFKAWHKKRVAEVTGELDKIKKRVEEQMKPENLLVEVLEGEKNTWVQEEQ